MSQPPFTVRPHAFPYREDKGQHLLTGTGSLCWCCPTVLPEVTVHNRLAAPKEEPS